MCYITWSNITWLWPAVVLRGQLRLLILMLHNIAVLQKHTDKQAAGRRLPRYAPSPGLQVVIWYMSCTHIVRSPLTITVCLCLPASTTNQSGLVTLTFDFLNLKVVSKWRVMWTTSVPILVYSGLSFLDLGPMYATDRRQTKASLNASAASAQWGRKHNKWHNWC